MIHIFLKILDFHSVYSSAYTEQEWTNKENPITRAIRRQTGNNSYLLDKNTLWILVERTCYIYRIQDFEEQILSIRLDIMNVQPPSPFVAEFIGCRTLDNRKEEHNGTVALP